MDVHIVTLVPPEPHAGWLAECRASVAAAAERHPLTHLQVLCTDLYDGRKATYQAGGLVGCLDYDDRIDPEAVARCVQALQQTGAGIAFTHQRIIGPDGAVLDEPTHTMNPRDVCSRPNSVHHFALMQSALLPKHLFELMEHMGAQLCVDWIVRAYLALRHGAVHVPMFGYDWRQHPGQASRLLDREYGPATARARSLIKTWAPFDQRLFQPFQQVV